ncbi:MAG: hypothetical protein U0W24_21655 [Bacteroidales bacterium]
MKKSVIQYSILMLIAAILMACPYASQVAIDNPGVKVQNSLLGKWIKAGDESNPNPNYFVITKFDDFKYKISKNEYNSYDSTYKETVYISHISKIDNLQFINMQQDGTGDYYLYKIITGDNDFTLFEVTDNIDEKFASSAELKSFIKKNMNLSFFYNKDEEKYFREN